jgi:hypothetical protein
MGTRRFVYMNFAGHFTELIAHLLALAHSPQGSCRRMIRPLVRPEGFMLQVRPPEESVSRGTWNKY